MFFRSFRMRVRNEKLSKSVAVDHFHDFGHATFVQFVEDVVKKQNGFQAALVFDELELCQFQGNQKRFLLALRAELLEWDDCRFQTTNHPCECRRWCNAKPCPC